MVQRHLAALTVRRKVSTNRCLWILPFAVGSFWCDDCLRYNFMVLKKKTISSTLGGSFLSKQTLHRLDVLRNSKLCRTPLSSIPSQSEHWEDLWVPEAHVPNSVGEAEGWGSCFGGR